MSDSEPRFGFKIWTEKEQDAGEDSPPLLIESKGTTLVGVFDGLGGSGGRRYKLGDHDRTGAFLASRTAALTVRRVFEAGALEPEHGNNETGFLTSVLRQNLQSVAGQFEPSESRVRSRMRRELPTTMAIASVQLGPSDSSGASANVGVWWAGDSRAYALRPDTGLSALTADHVVGGGDAMGNLTKDAPLENCLSADQEFYVESATYQLRLPVAVFAATDGCFGYVPTPMHFENMLLSSLTQAKDPDDWSTLLEERIVAVAADDAALSIVILGATFDEFQQLVQARRRRINEAWIVPIENALGDRARAQSELRRAEASYEATIAGAWSAYNAEYSAMVRSTKPADAGTETILEEMTHEKG